jgi:putative methyltransferase (TIGR04325 family)
MNDMKRLLRRVPGLRSTARFTARMTNAFKNWDCRGVYSTYDAAANAIPRWRRVGYDHDACANLYLSRLQDTKPSDYAVLFWLRPLLLEISSIFDLGGNLGWSYYSFQKYLQLPENLLWQICDVPAVVARGRDLAAERRATNLTFTTEFSDGDGHDVLLTCGTLQYLDRGLGEILGKLAQKPRHLFINRVPICDTPTFFTVQDIGPSSCPYRVSNAADFVESLRDLGYQMIDRWECRESSLAVVRHKERNLRFYTGFYFRLDR